MLARPFPIPLRVLLAGGLTLAGVTAVLALTQALASAQGNSPTLTLEICRANVEPCQNQVSIPVDGAVGLDLVLAGTPGNAAAELALVAGWETHLRVEDASVATPASQDPAGRPVQERGAAGLALNSLSPLSDDAISPGGRYFTVQNRYDPDTSRLDYAVTLVGSNPTGGLPQVAFSPGNSSLILGRITLQGAAPGVTTLLADGAVPTPFQVVTRDASGNFQAFTLGAGSGPLATLRIGPVNTPRLSGQIVRQETGGGTPPWPRVGNLTVSFWPAGAVPPWRGGIAGPVAVFHEVSTDDQGNFQVTDIAPSLLPAGKYDVRVQGSGTLARLVPQVTIPPAGSTGVVAGVNLDGLWAGDIDGDNVVDEADVLALQAGFGLLEGQTGFNANADFNGDGVVDVLDFSILAGSFGRRGE